MNTKKHCAKNSARIEQAKIPDRRPTTAAVPDRKPKPRPRGTAKKQ